MSATIGGRIRDLRYRRGMTREERNWGKNSSCGLRSYQGHRFGGTELNRGKVRYLWNDSSNNRGYALYISKPVLLSKTNYFGGKKWKLSTYLLEITSKKVPKRGSISCWIITRISADEGYKGNVP